MAILNRSIAQALTFASVVMVQTLSGDATAATFKCKNAAGKIEYTDQPCNNQPDAKPWTPKQPLNVMSRDAVSGQPSGTSAPPDKRPAWLKAPSPVGDCKAKGGTFDPEFKACRLP